jgi:hypothetical protein
MFAFLRTLSNFTIVPEAEHNFCTGFPFCHWPIYSSVHSSLDGGKIRLIVHVLVWGGGLPAFQYDIIGPQAGSCKRNGTVSIDFERNFVFHKQFPLCS